MSKKACLEILKTTYPGMLYRFYSFPLLSLVLLTCNQMPAYSWFTGFGRETTLLYKVSFKSLLVCENPATGSNVAAENMGSLLINGKFESKSKGCRLNNHHALSCCDKIFTSAEYETTCLPHRLLPVTLAGTSVNTSFARL